MSLRVGITRRQAALTVVAAGWVVAVSGCMGGIEDRPPAHRDADLPIVQVILGEFDGRDFSYRNLDLDAYDALTDSGAGVTAEALVEIPSEACSSATCTPGDYVAFSNVSGSGRLVVNGAASGTTPLWTSADVPNCGAVPTTGVCRQVRLRNLRSDQLERVYAELVELTPTGSSTAVAVPLQPFAATPDFGLTAPVVENGLWRFGEIGRNSPAPPDPMAGVTTWWAFTGSTPVGTDFAFRFLVQVRGQIVRPTERATVAMPDVPSANYPAVTSGSSLAQSSVSMSADARYVAFATSAPELLGFATTGTYIVRHDMITGANVVMNVDHNGSIPAGCISTNPSISLDGTRVAFENRACRLSSAGAYSGSRSYIFVRDVGAATTALASPATGGAHPYGSAQRPELNGVGDVVVFQSNATNLVASTPARNGCYEVYRHDLSAGTTTHVSAIAGTPANAAAGFLPGCTTPHPGVDPDVSDDGNTVVFVSAGPLVGADTNGEDDVYVYQHGGATSAVHRVSLTATGGQLTGAGFGHPAVSGDGGTVAFSSTATAILGSSSGRHIYRRSSDESSHSSLVRASVRPDGSQPSNTGVTTPWPSLSRTGRFISFWSNFINLTSPSLSFAGTQFVVCDLEAAESSLQRCFVVSRAQATPSSPFVAQSGSVAIARRTALACQDDDEACYVAYQATGPSSWAGMASSATQVFVSPVGDPRSQMPETAP